MELQIYGFLLQIYSGIHSPRAKCHRFAVEALCAPFCYRLEEKYTRFANLKARVINPAVNELVAKTSLAVTWKAIKKGKSVDRLAFHFTEKQQLSLAI